MENKVIQAVYNTIDDIAIVINADFEIEMINQKGLELFNIHDDYKHKKCYEIICKKNSIKEKCISLCKHLNNTVEEYEYIEQEGRYYQIKSTRIKGDSGKVEKLVDILHDVTAKIQADQLRQQHKDQNKALNEEYNSIIEELHSKNNLLAESEERYKSMFYDNKSIMLLIEPTTGKIVDANNAALNFYGYNRDEILALNITDVNILPEEQVKTEIENVIQGKRSYFLFSHKLANGEARDVQVYSGSINIRQKEFLYSIIHDITEQNIAKKKLELSEKQYRMLFENMNAAFALHEIVVDENNKPVDYRFIDCNPTFEKLTGLEATDIINKTVLEILPGTEKYWIETYGKVALEGVSISYTNYAQEFNKYYDIKAYSPLKGFFAVTFHDITERINSEKILKEQNEELEEAQKTALENEKVLKTIFDTAPVSMFLLDESARIIQANQTALEETQTSIENILGKFEGDIYKCVGTLNNSNGCGKGELCKRCEIQNTIRHTLISGEPIFKKEASLVVIDKSNHIEKTVLVSTSILYINRGKNILVTVDDITNRKKIENDLKINSQKYKALFDNIPVGVSLTDEKGNLIESNNISEEILGLSEHEHNQRKIDGSEWKIIKPDGSPFLAEEYASVRALKENRKVENVLMGIDKKSGITWINVSATPVPFDEYGVLISYTNVTELQSLTNSLSKAKSDMETLLERTIAQNKEIEQHNERLACLFRITEHPTDNIQEFLDFALKEAISLTNSKIGYLYYYNEETKQFILNSWSNEAMQECAITEPKTIYELEKTGLWGEAVRQRKPIIINDYSVPDKNKKGVPEGHVQLYKFLTIPVFSENKIVAVIGVANKETGYDDIDIRQLTLLMDSVWKIVDKQALIEDLTKAKERAEESDKLKSSFLANMSHEIRTPLNGILGFSSMLTNREKIPAVEKLRYQSIIDNCSGDLLRIIDDILDISKLESGNVEIINKPFSVNKLLIELYTLYENKLFGIEKEITLIEKNIEEKIILNSDESRLRQVFVNLLDNAIKFTDSGSIEFGIHDVENQKLVLYVKDTGIGISEDKQNVIFDRFRQVETDLNRNFGGNGLGLAIVKEIIKLFKGEIWLKSEFKKGTTFYFSLPYSHSYTLEQEKEVSILPKEKNKILNVLIVEDDEINLEFLKIILIEEGYNVSFVQNGDAAVKIAKKYTFDIIFMDIRLPGINGLEAVKQIRAFNADVYIIAQTAYAMQGDEQKALEAGCNDYITKPIKRELLLQKMNVLV